MNIVFVDDRPIAKVDGAINYLRRKFDFDYQILFSENEALYYISKNISDIDLIVLDLGLPIFKKDYSDYHEFAGYEILNEIIMRLNVTDIPIIINSTNRIEFYDGRSEEEHFKEDYPKAIIEHVEYLDGEWLEEFIKKNLSHKF